MSENFDLIDNEEAPTSYSSSTPAPATNRPAIKAPGAGTGRRKEAYTLSLHDALPRSAERRVGKECMKSMK